VSIIKISHLLKPLLFSFGSCDTHAVFFFSWFGAFHRDFFIFQQSVDVFLEFPFRGVAFIDDVALSVDQNYMRNATDTVILACCAIFVFYVVVLNLVPLFGFDVILELVHVFIARKTNDADLISPILFSCFKHMLIVSHRRLARSAPCCPEI